MNKIRIVFLGYLWKIPLALYELRSIEIIGIGLESERKNTLIAASKLTQLKNLFFNAEKINENDFAISIFRKCDYIIIGAFGQILKKNVLELPKIGVCNFHTSLLPKLRVGNPIENLIMQGERVGGVTFHWVDEGIDSGSIIARKKLNILQKDHYLDIYEKYHLEFEKMASNIKQYLTPGSNIFRKLIINEKASNCKKFKVKDRSIAISDNIDTIFKKIKAFGYFNNAILTFNNKTFSCRRASIKKNLRNLDGISISSKQILVCKGTEMLQIIDYKEH